MPGSRIIVRFGSVLVFMLNNNNNLVTALFMYQGFPFLLVSADAGTVYTQGF